MTTEQYTRMALVGRADAESPSDTEIAPWKDDALVDIFTSYPCLSDTYNPSTDIEAVAQGARWLGYATAILMRQGGWRLGGGPTAGSGLSLVKIEKADVTEEYRQISPKAAAEEIAGFEAVIARAKSAFPCVVAADAPPAEEDPDYNNGVSFGMGIGGFRRSRGGWDCEC